MPGGACGHRVGATRSTAAEATLPSGLTQRTAGTAFATRPGIICPADGRGGAGSLGACLHAVTEAADAANATGATKPNKIKEAAQGPRGGRAATLRGNVETRCTFRANRDSASSRANCRVEAPSRIAAMKARSLTYFNLESSGESLGNHPA